MNRTDYVQSSIIDATETLTNQNDALGRTCMMMAIIALCGWITACFGWIVAAIQ